MKEKAPLRKIDFTKIDRVEFLALLDEQLVGVQQGMRDLTIAIGEVVGHANLAKALNTQLIDGSPVRNAVGRPVDRRSLASRIAARRAGSAVPNLTRASQRALARFDHSERSSGSGCMVRLRRLLGDRRWWGAFGADELGPDEMPVVGPLIPALAAADFLDIGPQFDPSAFGNPN